MLPMFNILRGRCVCVIVLILDTGETGTKKASFLGTSDFILGVASYQASF